MPPKSQLPRLRQIRNQQRRAKALTPERDELIREALADGAPERQVAVATGLTPGRINQIRLAPKRKSP